MGLAFPNGMAVTPDNSTLIVAESYLSAPGYATIGVRSYADQRLTGCGPRSGRRRRGRTSPARVAQLLNRPTLPRRALALPLLLGAYRVGVRAPARLDDWYPRGEPLAVEARRLMDAVPAAAVATERAGRSYCTLDGGPIQHRDDLRSLEDVREGMVLQEWSPT